MYGSSPSNGQWGSQGGYSRTGADHQSPGNDWSSQNYNSNTQSQNWSNRSGYDALDSDPGWSDSGTQRRPRADLDDNNTFSGESDNLNAWSKPSPNNRKRPLLMDEDDYPRSGSNYSRPRSGNWPRSDNRSSSTGSRPSRASWNESGGRSDSWSSPNSLSKRPPWSKANTGTSSTGVGRDISSRFSDSASTTNNWPKPNNFPKPNWQKSSFSDSWEHSDTQPKQPWENTDQSQGQNRFTQKPFSKFARPFFSKGEGFRPKLKLRSQMDTQSVLDSMVTTYYVNQEKVNMPKELTSQFEPLKCGLCEVVVNSTVTAKTHYSGKMHDKKVVQFMQKWFADKGQPLPDQFKEGVSRKQGISELEEMRALYCSVCDIPLTSKQHAEQHYMGRGHKKALDAGGVKKHVPAIMSDPTGRFTFGLSFLKETDPLSLNVPEPKPKSNANPFICELCNVSTTSKEQLEVHLGGARHRKKVGATTNPDGADKQKIPPPAAKGDTILETVVQRPKGAGRSENQDGTDEKKKDFSIFRTPSGQFYCATCNVTMNSESQFGQHNDSKRHKLNVTNSKTKNSGTNSTGSAAGGAAMSTATVTSGTAIVSTTGTAIVPTTGTTSGSVNPVVSSAKQE